MRDIIITGQDLDIMCKNQNRILKFINNSEEDIKNLINKDLIMENSSGQKMYFQTKKVLKIATDEPLSEHEKKILIRNRYIAYRELFKEYLNYKSLFASDKIHWIATQGFRDYIFQKGYCSKDCYMELKLIAIKG